MFLKESCVPSQPREVDTVVRTGAAGWGRGGLEGRVESIVDSGGFRSPFWAARTPGHRIQSSSRRVEARGKQVSLSWAQGPFGALNLDLLCPLLVRQHPGTCLPAPHLSPVSPLNSLLSPQGVPEVCPGLGVSPCPWALRPCLFAGPWDTSGHPASPWPRPCSSLLPVDIPCPSLELRTRGLLCFTLQHCPLGTEPAGP